MEAGGNATGRSVASAGSRESTSSNDRLEEALRQAAVQAGTQGIGFDENGDVSMELAGDDITNAFKPWVQRNKRDSVGLQKLSYMQDQESVNPFSPAFKAEVISHLANRTDGSPANDETQDMSMDMTLAMGAVIQQVAQEGMSERVDQPKSLKRRRLSSNLASQGSPAKRTAGRRSSIRRRRSSIADSAIQDDTMDFTAAIGGIKQIEAHSEARRESIETSLDDETMDFTMVQGGIVGTAADEDDQNADEDLSMEMTATLDKTIEVQKISSETQSPATYTSTNQAT